MARLLFSAFCRNKFNNFIMFGDIHESEITTDQIDCNDDTSTYFPKRRILEIFLRQFLGLFPFERKVSEPKE
jgi:hypothetical protein